MSTQGSEPKASSPGTLASRAEERFFTLDHVGVVRHIEGVGLDLVVSSLEPILGEGMARVERATEEIRGLMVHTCIAPDWPRPPFTLWLTAKQFEGVGVVVDAKIFHSTDSSAEADEELSRFMERLQEDVVKQR